MQTRGFDAAPISEQVEAIGHDDWRASNPRAGLIRAVRTFCERAAYDGPDLREAIAQERPDAVIVDINSWGALAVAEAWGGPWAAFCPYPLALRSRDLPPFGLGGSPEPAPSGACATASRDPWSSRPKTRRCCHHSTPSAPRWALPDFRPPTISTAVRGSSSI